MLLMPQHECNITSRRVTHHSSLLQQERRAQETTSYFQLKISKMSFKGVSEDRDPCCPSMTQCRNVNIKSNITSPIGYDWSIES